MDGAVKASAAGETLVRQLFDAVAGDLRLLLSLHDREAGELLLSCLRAEGFPASLGLAVRSEAARQGAALLERALAEIPQPAPPAVLDELAADYAAIYLTHAHRASPCESVWLDEEELALQEPVFQLRAWYRRHGLGVENWRKRSEDHLVVQLHFLSLCFARPEVPAAELARFMDEHLLRWLTPFAQRVASRCATAFYAGAAMLTAGYCEELRDVLAEVLGEPRPGKEELEHALAPKPRVQAVPVAFLPGREPSW